jgi:hypothetical protein
MSYMLRVAFKPIIQGVIMLNVIVLNDVGPTIFLRKNDHKKFCKYSLGRC